MNDTFDRLPEAAVIMCTWNRPELFGKTLDTLAAQAGVTPILYVWNNNPNIAEVIDRHAKTAAIKVVVSHHHENIGGFGRFYMAREVAHRYPYVIFIDDDQTLEPDTLRTLLAEARPQAIHGWWAFEFTGSATNYWVRKRVLPGSSAHYIGTCGMIADSSLFADERLYECPEKYWFIEDLWLCYVANHFHGWKLTATHAAFTTVMDMKNQAPGLIQKKAAFLKYLIKQGWKLSPLGAHKPRRLGKRRAAEGV